MEKQVFETKIETLLKDWSIEDLSLNEILSKKDKTIIYFYPKDNTPWCSIEAQDFTCLSLEFEKLWISIIWVSKDSIESHKKFVSDLSLWIDLISDKDLLLHKALWAFWEKNNYWKIIMWVIRSTFLFNSKWHLLKEWRNVNATWHAAKILKELQT